MKLLFLAVVFGLFVLFPASGTYIIQYHTIKKGETLSSLAIKYHVSVEELKNWNNINSNKIMPGQRIIVKKYQKKDEDLSYYTVKKGDNLYEISKKTGVSVEKIKDYNNLSTSTLYPGQKLKIASLEQIPVVEKKSQTIITDVPSDTYIVKKGDTLLGISKKTGISVYDLKKFNNLKDSKLAIGQKLVLRVNDIPTASETQQIASVNITQEKHNKNQQVAKAASKIYINRYHTIKKGDSLSKIANKYGTTVANIKLLNGLKSNTIHPGKTIIVARIVKEVSPPLVSPTPIAPVTPKIYYRVKLGDTLESIAEKFGISVAALKESNLLFDGSIKIGQTLVIPEVANREENIGFETSISTEKEIYDTSKFLALKIIENAMNFINTPYRYGGLSQKGIDCSGLVKKSYEAAGIFLPRTSKEQSKEGEIIPLSAIKPGDLLFFGNKGYINHVGIYIGDNKFIHASREVGKVVVANLNDQYYQKHLIYARTFINGDIMELTEKEN